jgi:hypothetical protein
MIRVPEVGEERIPRTPKWQSDTAYYVGCNRCEHYVPPPARQYAAS